MMTSVHGVTRSFHRNLPAQAGIRGVIDLGAAGDVILGLGSLVAPLEQFVRHGDVEGIRPGPGAERDHQDAVAGFGHVQDGGQTDDGGPGVGVADDRRQQPGRDLLRRESEQAGGPLRELGVGLVEDGPSVIVGGRPSWLPSMTFPASVMCLK